MAINSQFFLNAADLSLATAVYIDSFLLNIAPDGFYSDGTITREQSGGILLAATTCPTCELQTTCFEGIWEFEDPAHPNGGTITYINVDGELVTQIGIWLGDFAVIEHLEIISFVGVSEIDCEGVGLDMAIRSDGTSTSVDICDLEVLDTNFYILGNAGCVIETGNIAYNTDSLLDPFDGGDLYYIAYVAICESTTDTYIIQINSVGYITVIDVCEAPPP
jgi:hypothetical protein